MKKLTASLLLVMAILYVCVFTGCEPYRYSTTGPQTIYETPHWAPPVYSGIRYYYLPDIESYYDIHTREFIFLDHARWIYSREIPYMYRDFDLNTCFVVIVNSNIYQPWMHHQYYVSHFPRYYYRDYYDHSNIPWVRGYDENFRRAVYWRENERDRARSWDDQNLRNNRQFRYSREDRQQQNQGYYRNEDRPSPGDNRSNVNTGNNSGTNTPRENPENRTYTRRPQVEPNNGGQPADNYNSTRQRPATPADSARMHKTNYYGRPIGQPVKVERQMRNPDEPGSSGNNTRREETNTRSRSGRR
jgi:hypothetical protein